LVDRPPNLPHRHAEEARRGALAEFGSSTYAAARIDWVGARAIFAAAQRQGRSFSSSKRRFVMDLLTFLVRQERTIAQVLAEAGLPDSAGRERVERARFQAALVLFGGLPPSQVDWQGPPVDWDAVADPRHCLEGWFRREGPSPALQLAVFGSLPDWLAQRLVDAPDATGLVASLNRRGPICLRVNRPASTREELVNELEGATACRFATGGVVLPNHVDARALPALAEGRADIQDEGSQLIVELAAPRPGERVIDACAGALGKSLAIASEQEDQGEVLATDVRKDALRRGLKRARKAGYRSVRTADLDSVRGPADLVLVDAPCSGTGALRRRPWTRWSVHSGDLSRLVTLQREILQRASGWVGPGGRLVYATCSLLAEENDDVVTAFLGRNKGWELQPSAEILGTTRADEIGTSGVLRLYPHIHGTDGFYAAVMRRS